MYSSMEIVILAAKRQVRGSTYGEQGRLNDGADGGELAELRTTAAAPERTVGSDSFCAPSVAFDFNGRWSFPAADAADCSVLGPEYRDSVSLVVENEAQSCSRFSRRDAYSTDRLALPAKWVPLRPRSDVVLVGRKQRRGMGCFGVRGCVRLAAFGRLFLRQDCFFRLIFFADQPRN